MEESYTETDGKQPRQKFWMDCLNNMIRFRSRSKFNLNKCYTREGILFSIDADNGPRFPLNTTPPEILAKLLEQGGMWAALDELWASGFLKASGGSKWIIPYSTYDTIDPIDEPDIYETLKLPLPENLQLNLRSFSNVADKNFRISVEAYHPGFGPLREDDPPRFGCVFFIGEDDIIALTQKQAELFEIAKGDTVDWENLDDRMAYLAKTKKAAVAANAQIDGYIESENYEFISDSKLDFQEEGPDEIRVIPEIEGIEKYGFDGKNLLRGQVPTVLSRAERGQKRNRLVLDKSLHKKLSDLPAGGVYRGTDVPKLLVNPEQVIPEGFDLSLFSKRVKGIKTRVYNSRPYLHVNKNKGGWFDGVPGISLEDWSPVSGDPEGGKNDFTNEGVPDGLSEDTYRELLKRAKESGEEYVLHEGNWIRIDPKTGDDFFDTIDSLDRQNSGAYKIPTGSILEIYENLELLEFIDEKSLIDEENLLPDDLPQIDPPSLFKGELYPFQLNGYRWLSRLSNHFIGGLLADEMGLGKTVQVITHLLNLKETGEAGKNLIVMSKTLMDNWVREIRKFSGGRLSTYSYDGSARTFNPDFFDQFDVILTTYDTLRRDQAKLGTVNWNMLVCDEAQYAKNPTTQRTCAIKALKSKHRAALTGTPVENGLIEFWCIMDFVQPGLLGSWADFRSKYERPIVIGEDEDRESKIQELLKEIKGYYLRRLKSEHLDLPPKNPMFRETNLSAAQLEIYQKIAHIGKSGGKGAALAAIQKLIMLCAHPSAVPEHYHGDGLSGIHCPKLDEAIKIIREVRERSEKLIVFSEFKAIQRVLQDRIRKEFGLWADIINGEITQNRQTIIDIFSDKIGFNVLILGHTVAGVGLNITAANNVIHYTRPWNPAKENQATDRVHRIGQSKPVNIYYPIVKDERFTTVEARLDELIRSKESLAQDVLRPTAELRLKPEDLMDCLDIASKK